MKLGLEGKVALVTGATGGLGAACARILAQEGAALFLTSRTGGALAKLAGRLNESGETEARWLAADLRSTDAAQAVAKAAQKTFGKVDVLVNSAGASAGGLFWEIEDAVWQDSLALKFMATVRMIRAVLPAMIEQRYGRIVTLAGNSGREPDPRLLPGAAANAALLAVTAGLAREVAESGVVINAVNPGPTRTMRWEGMMEAFAVRSGRTPQEEEQRFVDAIPQRRLGDADEVARLVAFLAGDAAPHMTGRSITADGGASRAIL
ncbi:MAG: SDR family oxidoreductase [Gammaproteobacteria bacterium]|nr:SDR family oxidoreductase [Gammaproteobacteria bacterium]MCY4254698.1 SDR family oxidoreductase [Gammaproteobacteria bacterium]